MFGFTGVSDSKESAVKEVSLIGSGTTIGANAIHGSGDLRIEGCVQTDINQEGRVVVAPDGEVSGTLRARSIRVSGTVNGEVYATESLVLTESSVVRANIYAPELSIESGADLQGEVIRDADVDLTPLTESPSSQPDESPTPFIDESAKRIFPLDSELDGVET